MCNQLQLAAFCPVLVGILSGFRLGGFCYAKKTAKNNTSIAWSRMYRLRGFPEPFRERPMNNPFAGSGIKSLYGARRCEREREHGRLKSAKGDV